MPLTLNLDHPYAAFLLNVQKPARYLGGEFGQTRKDWRSVAGTLCLAYPDLYEIGMSHLGLKILGERINREADLLGERVFQPALDLERELAARGLPLVSLESHRPLADFDVLGFSLQYELTYPGVLAILAASGIPLLSAERTAALPLIAAGGPCAFHAEPLAPFIDAFVTGDGEEVTVELLRRVARLKRSGRPRREWLEAIAELPGVYCPALHEAAPESQKGMLIVQRGPAAAPWPIPRAPVADLHKHPFPHGGPQNLIETVFDRYSIEIARGCQEGCRFCQAGILYRPLRERKPEAVLAAIAKAVNFSGTTEVGLTALSTADYSALIPLVQEAMGLLAPKGVALSVSSLRAYGLPGDLLDQLARVRATGLTFAPEAGSERLRRVINKNVTGADLETALGRAFQRGWDRIKLYFMIGLPTETEDDVAAIGQVSKQAAQLGRQHAGGRAKISASVSIFVPKPHTPFQWAEMAAAETILRKQELLRREVRGPGLSLKFHDFRQSRIEGILSRGDRRLAEVLAHVYRQGGRFEAWDEHFSLERWESAFAACRIEPGHYLSSWPEDAALPWEHLSTGVTKEFLLEEWRLALAERNRPACGKPPAKATDGTSEEPGRVICYQCGLACDLEELARQHRAPEAGTAAPEHEAPPRANLRVTRRTGGVEPGGHRYRLTYSRLGPMALAGHLDLTRLWPRLIFRAGLRPVLSQGFHPKPIMAFSHPLPLGLESLGELVEFRLHDSLEPAELLKRLERTCPEGLAIGQAVALPLDAPRLAAACRWATYLVTVDGAAARQWQAGQGAAGTEASPALAQRIESLLGLTEIKIVRQRHHSQRQIDIRPGIRELRLQDAAALPAFLGIAGDALAFAMVLSTGDLHVPRPAEVIGELLTGAAVPYRVVRLGFAA